VLRTAFTRPRSRSRLDWIAAAKANQRGHGRCVVTPRSYRSRAGDACPTRCRTPPRDLGAVPDGDDTGGGGGSPGVRHAPAATP
jgi:hypothetical protein